MPELPEVETTLRAVRPILVGNCFLDIEVLRPNMTGHDPRFVEKLRGRSVTDIRRLGKYLLAQLDDDRTLLLHLKMSGRLGLRQPGDAPLTYERIRFHLGCGELLIFNDPRTLGRALIIETKDIDRHPSLKLLGPDALLIPEEEFVARLRKKKGILKAVLLNQSFVAGIGNIYADEACFLAKIDPNRQASSLSDAERRTLHRATQKTLMKGIANMGTSFSDFADLFGKPGKNQKVLSVYGRAGKPCLECGTILQRSVVGQRGTVWCWKCQK